MKIKGMLLMLLCFSVFANVQAQDSELGALISLETATGVLHGTLLAPASKKPVPVVLLLSGSGPTDRDGNNPMAQNNSLKMLAEGLYEKGIASVRFDKRGVAESKGAVIAEQDLRFDHYVQDATLWIQKLTKDKRFNKVVVLGHSEGSLIGMLAAEKAKADGYISVAGAGQAAGKMIRKQLQPQPAMVTDMAFPILDKLEAGETVKEVNPLLAALFRPSVQPYLISWFKYDPQVEIKKLSLPVLLVHGEQDLQVSVEDAQRLAAALPKAQLVMVPEMNHVLKTTSIDKSNNIAAYSNPTLPLAHPLLPAITTFIKAIK